MLALRSILEDAHALLKKLNVPATEVHWVYGAGEMADGLGEEIGYVVNGVPCIARVCNGQVTVSEGWDVP